MGWQHLLPIDQYWPTTINFGLTNTYPWTNSTISVCPNVTHGMFMKLSYLPQNNSNYTSKVNYWLWYIYESTWSALFYVYKSESFPHMRTFKNHESLRHWLHIGWGNMNKWLRVPIKTTKLLLIIEVELEKKTHNWNWNSNIDNVSQKWNPVIKQIIRYYSAFDLVTRTVVSSREETPETLLFVIYHFCQRMVVKYILGSSQKTDGRLATHLLYSVLFAQLPSQIPSSMPPHWK